MADATINDIRKFFAYDSAASFRQDYAALTAQDKADLKVGLSGETPTLTY